MRTANEVKQWFTDETNEANHFWPTTQGQRGAMLGELNKTLGGDANRKLFLKAIFNVTSSRELTDHQWFALKTFIGISPLGDAWVPRPDFEAEARLVLEKQADQEGQLKMFDAEKITKELGY